MQSPDRTAVWGPSPALAALVALPLLLAACSSGASAGQDNKAGAEAEIASFDAGRAWALLEAQVALGPRPSGSPQLELNRRLIEKELDAAGLKPKREGFLAETPIGTIEMANIYADLPGRARGDKPAPIVILCSHFDTKRMDGHPTKSEREGRFVGANDGASSTAVLLELARVLAAAPQRDVTYRFLFVDGEEATRWQWLGDDNCYGSRHHATELRRSGEVRNVKAAVVIDMVGDADLSFTRDPLSTPELLEIFFKAARRIGLPELTTGRPQSVLDDHRSFKEIDIPACDLIDLDYTRVDSKGRVTDLWHTVEDVPANCSQESLDKAGRVVLAGLPGVEAYVLP